MAEVFGWVAAHGDTTIAPTTRGRRPQVNVLIRFEDLQNRAHAPASTTAAPPTPPNCAGCAATPGSSPSSWTGVGQPLDVGRQARTVPDGMRRAVTARDRGCAHPGCTRPPSWCEIHHIHEWELGGDTALSNLVCTTGKSILPAGPYRSPPTVYPSSSHHCGSTSNRNHDEIRPCRNRTSADHFNRYELRRFSPGDLRC
jgi:hypothetical protein